MDKPFFRYATVAEQLARASKRGVSKHFVREIVNIEFDETLVLKPSKPFFEGTWNAFMKHGPTINLKRFESLPDAVNTDRLPSDLREEAFSSIRSPIVAGYTFKSFYLNDYDTRRVNLTRCLDGELTYIYGNIPQVRATGDAIIVRPYDSGAKIPLEGADVEVVVPSQTMGDPAYSILFSAIPLVKNEEKWGIAFALSAEHSCLGRRYRTLRGKSSHPRELSRQVLPCEHEIAGRAALIDYYLNQGNRVPLQMNTVAFGTQFMLYVSRKLKNNCLIQLPGDKKPRALNPAEQEILCWALVKEYGPGKTLMPNFERIKNYKTEKLP